MVIRRWRTCICLTVLLPIIIAAIDLEAMFVLMSLLILTLCGRSLCDLVVANFATDEFAARYSESNSFAPTCKKDVKVTQAVIFGINILIILYYISALRCGLPPFAMIMGTAVSLGWLFDLGRTLIHYVTPPDIEAEWTLRDTLLEIFMWSHNILNVVFVLVLFTLRFF